MIVCVRSYLNVWIHLHSKKSFTHDPPKPTKNGFISRNFVSSEMVCINQGLKDKTKDMFGGVPLGALVDDVQATLRNTQAVSLQFMEKPPSPSDIHPDPQDITEEAVSDSELPKGKKSKKSKTTKAFPPKAPKMTTGKRGLSSEIQRNRGLTPYRPRDRKNPRRRHRLRFETKEKRRKGQRPMHAAAPDRYGGEASGISKIKKSIKFG